MQRRNLKAWLSLLLLSGTPAVATPPKALPRNASPLELTFQPAYDYDKDGCYPTPGIGIDGTLATGLPMSGDTGSVCRTVDRLANTNSYSRALCAGFTPGAGGQGTGTGWCAIVNTLYFEKDQVSWGPGSAGHRHDWEHVVVWVNVSSVVVDSSTSPSAPVHVYRGGTVAFVSTSNHGSFTVHPRAQLRFDDEPVKRHAKAVYHKDGVSTHCFREGRSNDDPPENHRGVWQYPDLVGWDGYPSLELRTKLATHNFGEANFGVKDGSWQSNIKKSMPGQVKGFVVDGVVASWRWEPAVVDELIKEEPEEGQHVIDEL